MRPDRNRTDASSLQGVVPDYGGNAMSVIRKHMANRSLNAGPIYTASELEPALYQTINDREQGKLDKESIGIAPDSMQQNNEDYYRRRGRRTNSLQTGNVFGSIGT